MLWEDLRQDARYATRMMRRNPGFTAVAVLSVAMGIGAATSVFSVVDRLLFRSLPYPQDERLVSVGISAPMMPYDFLFGAMYLGLREQPTGFDALTSWSGIEECDLTDPGPARLSCAAVESSFLKTLGIRPAVGRGFSREEDRVEGPRAILISHALWKERFGGSEEIAGRSIRLNGQPARFVGVLPSDFEMPTLDHVDLLVPQGADDAALRRAVTGRPLRVIGRLKAGVSAATAHSVLEARMESALRSAPAQVRKELRVRVRPLRDLQVGDARLAAWVLFGAVLAVLLICCANVANLLLTRAMGRRRELAVRAALGAGRRRLIRQVMTESLALSLAGGAAGIGLAALLLRLFVAIAPEGIPRLQQATLDTRVLLFALACSLAAGILFGLAPAFQRSPADGLAGARATSGAAGMLRRGIVVAQISISLSLLTGASLMVRTLRNLQSAPLGFRTERVLTASLALTPQRYPESRRQLSFFEQLEERLRQAPGVTAVAISDSLPPNTPARSQPFFALQVEGRTTVPEGAGGTVVWRAVTPDYFAALEIPILRGRGFREEDRRPGERPVVLSESLARRLFGNADPLGRLIRMGDWFTVTGVARDAQNSGPAMRNDPEYYVVRSHDAAYGRYNYPGMLRRAGLVVRGVLTAEAMANTLRKEIAALDPALPVNVESMQERVGKLAVRPRFNAALLGLFSLIGVLLAAVGLYGVVAFLAARRTREIGVRMALGATPASITHMMLRQALRWILLGSAAGLAGSLAVMHGLRALLFGIAENDPWIPAGALGLLLVVTLAAAWVPSRRAATVDPLGALRHE